MPVVTTSTCLDLVLIMGQFILYSISTTTAKAEGYTIYADLCTIPQETLRKHNIIFKKIPRDIARL